MKAVAAAPGPSIKYHQGGGGAEREFGLGDSMFYDICMHFSSEGASSDVSALPFVHPK